MPKTTPHRARKATRVRRKRASASPIADYSDVVTDRHFDRIRTLVDQDELKDAKEVGKPGW